MTLDSAHSWSTRPQLLATLTTDDNNRASPRGEENTGTGYSFLVLLSGEARDGNEYPVTAFPHRIPRDPRFDVGAIDF
jgi:hypothetical protein